MAKPFGKPVHHGRALTKGMRLTIALWVAALPAYFLCRTANRAYPTLAESPFFWPATWTFTAFYAAVWIRWLLKRPTPRPPGTGRTGRILAYVLVGCLVGFPGGLVSSLLYEPALKLANGLGSFRSRSVEHALVDKAGADWVLDSPYWSHEFRRPVPNVSAMPQDVTPGSLAKVTLRTGLLGARWIESVEYTVLR
jgi:hypothetical protein